MKQVIKDLNSKKFASGDTPNDNLKKCKFTFFVLADCSGTFFDCLEEANVSSNFKKDDPLD